MTQEEISIIRNFVRKHLHNHSLVEDCTQHICMRVFENPLTNWKWALIDFARWYGLTTKKPRLSARVLSTSSELFDRHVISEPKDDIDLFEEIEEQLLAKGTRKELVDEAITLLKNRDYSGMGSLFRRIGYEVPVDLPWQKHPNADRYKRLSDKIIKHFRIYDKETQGE